MHHNAWSARRMRRALFCLLLLTQAARPDDAPATASKAKKGFSFRGLEVFKTEGGASRLRTVDWNSDGLIDLAVVNNSRATIDFFIQKTAAEIASSEAKPVEFDNVNEIASDARFKKETFLTEKRVFDLLVDDLNGDKTPDLAFYGDPKELVVVLRAPPGGTESRQKFAIPEARAFGRGLGAGDLNGDGKTDLALLGAESTHLFYQGADGKLAPPVEVPNSEKNYSALYVADLNGDGKKDLLLVGTASVEPIRVRLQGPAGLGPEVAIETPAFRAALVTDLNGDGRAELSVVQGATGRLVVFQLETGPPEGGSPFGRMRLFPFATGEESSRQTTTVADVDGDGRADVLETSPGTAQLKLHRQGQDGELLAPVAFPTLAGASNARAADIDGDGKAEVIVLSADEKSIGVSKWDGSRLTFPRSLPLKAKPVSCDLVDLDGKPGAELGVVVDDEGKGSIRFFKAGDPLTEAGDPLVLKDAKDAPDRIRFVDLNQDGRVDIAAFFPYETMRVLLGQAKVEDALPLFADVSSQKDFGRGLLQGAVPGSFAVGDLDGDGKAEMLLAKKNFARAFRITPKNVLEVVEQFNSRDAGSEIVGVALGDFLGDKTLEIALLDKARNQLLFLEKSGMGTYAVAREVKVPAFTYRGLVAADMNGDGRLDLVVEGEGRFGILHAGGSDFRLKRVAEYEDELKDAYLDLMAAGDLDSDGRTDIVVSELRSHLLEILTQDGGLTRAERFKVFEDSGRGEGGDEKKSAREPREIAVADVTGDGKADIVLLIHDRIIVYPQE